MAIGGVFFFLPLTLSLASAQETPVSDTPDFLTVLETELPATTPAAEILSETPALEMVVQPTPIPVNGACGTADGVAISSAPTADLCGAGTASAVTATGLWSWSCDGSDGGTSVSCSAPLLVPIPPAPVVEIEMPQSETILPQEDNSADYALYKKYLLYQKYEKRVLYQNFERYQRVAGRSSYFENRKHEKKYLKAISKKYKKYIKRPTKYAQYAPAASEFTSYSSNKNEYFAMKPYSGYGSLSRFNRPEYDAYSNYGGSEYLTSYQRYLAAIAEGKATDRGDADLSAGVLGPDITVGIFNYIPNDLKSTALRVKANGSFSIVNKSGEKLIEIPAEKNIRVKYIGEKVLRVYDSNTDTTIGEFSKEVRFETLNENTVFDVSRPNSSFDRYRGDIKLRFYDSPVTGQDRIWIINTIPLEHYVWGMGEITGIGPDEYDKVMTTIFRTYGYWKIKWSTKYADQGFKVDATAGSQVYLGYDWEITHPDIRKAAEATRGKLVMYDREVALTPYSSWTDGATRRFEDGHWGHSCKTETGIISELYPWLNAIADPKGRNPTEATCALASRGNHMVGLSANGAVRLAKDDLLLADPILEYYYAGIDLVTGY